MQEDGSQMLELDADGLFVHHLRIKMFIKRSISHGINRDRQILKKGFKYQSQTSALLHRKQTGLYVDVRAIDTNIRPL